MPQSSRKPREPRAEELAPEPRTFGQARARATYESLLEAARSVFSTRGYDDAQTPDIAAAAKVSVGTVYRYFRDKRHLFVEMIAQHLAEVHEQIALQITPDKFGRTNKERRHVIEHALDLLCAHIRRDPTLYRVYLGVSLRDPEVAALRRRFEKKGEDLIAQLIEVLAPGSGIANPQAAAHVIVVAALEVTLSRAGLRLPEARASRGGVSDEQLREALSEMIHRFVFPS